MPDCEEEGEERAEDIGHRRKKLLGFTEEGRTSGSCRCYRILLSGIAVAAVRPEKSRYQRELIEVITPVHLRLALGLKDGEPLKSKQR